uniref:Essential meiotic structure-specific endonuclease subunit 2 n=1 Tax=Tetraodon nigroviridis TaxID=99883 RepID=H3D5I8_TETNG
VPDGRTSARSVGPARKRRQSLKSLRPENYLRSLTVGIDPALLQQEGSDLLLDTLATLDWRFAIAPQVLPRSVTWSRASLEGDDRNESVEEEQAVLVLDMTDFIEGAQEGGHSLVNRVSSRFAWMNPQKLSEVCLFSLAHLVFLFIVLSGTDAPGEQVLYETLHTKLGMENLDVEEVLVYLQVCRNISLVFLGDWQKVTDHVCAVTKALSKRPYRLLTERPALPFCLEGSWASGVRVERDGSGLVQVWRSQLQQLNRVSSAAASAVTTAYPSPQLLLQAYWALAAEAERKGLLAGLLVRSGDNERRLGPEMSARIYRYLTAQNPQLVLD